MTTMTATTGDGVRGGWVLAVRCGVRHCGAEDEFRGFIPTQAEDAALAAGWLVDRGQVFRGGRVEVCPEHTETHALVGGIVVSKCDTCGTVGCDDECWLVDEIEVEDGP